MKPALKKFIFTHKKISIASAVFLLLLIFHFCYVHLIPYNALNEFLGRKNSVTIYDRNMRLIQVTSVDDGVRRQYTPLKDIPSEIKAAFIKAEDNRFYDHGGVDYRALLRALKQNTSEMRTVSGASTITMQLARMVSPSARRSLMAKIKDVYNSWRIECRLSKEQILEAYLNSVPFGNNVEGVTSAARYYFNRELTELSQEEIYSLAVIPRNPSRYNPLNSPEHCARAASLLCDKSAEEIEGQLKKITAFEWPFYMPHYVVYLKKHYGEDFGRKITELHLGADLNAHEYIQFQIYTYMEKLHHSRIENAAALAIDNETGAVIVWTGGKNWFDDEHSGQIDGVLVPNQMGSSMKPFLYALALDRGMKTTEVIPDIPMDFGSDEVYMPLNFNNRFNGPVIMRNALASSLNVPAVYTLSKVGVQNYYQCLLKLGFDSLKEGGIRADLGLALGGGEVTLKELVTAFSVFPRDGKYIPLTYEEGEECNPDEVRQIYRPDSARIICSILSDKKARIMGFGFSQTFQTSYPSIFKTGTANQYQNIVALGATDRYTVGVWMGNHSGNTVMGKTGSSVPATIARELLDFLTDKKAGDFKLPENYKRTKVCAVSGMAANSSCPNVTEEFVMKEELESFCKEKCSWHSVKNGKLETVYPAEYQKWVSGDFKNTRIDYSSSPLKIVSPKNNAHFYADDTRNQYQKITVEVTGGASSQEQLEVVIDGGKAQFVERPFIFNIPVRRGKHKLNVTLGEESDVIEFDVE